MRRLVTLKLALFSLLIAACVTINVYFPAAAAEKAADRITKEILGEGAATEAPPTTDKTSMLRPGDAHRLLLAAANGVLNFVIPTAQAQADLNVSSAEIRAIQSSLTTRTATLRKYYDSGAIGFTADGLVDVRDQNAIPLPERGTVRGLVAEENKDRMALYAAIAKANNHPEWERDIRDTFAKQWIANAPAGWYYKDAGGAWKQK